MKLSACLLLLLVGCTEQDGPKYDISTPSGPGGNGSPSGSGTAARISGRVCVLADPQILDACSIKGAGGLTVAMGSATATTSADGSFTIEPTPNEGNGGSGGTATAPFSVTGTGIVPSQRAMAANGSTIIPVMSNDLYNQMVLATGITTEPDTGSVLASITTPTGFPKPGITATADPALAAGPYFDATGTSPWTLNATGARGVAYFPNISTLGPSSLTFTDPTTGGETTVDGIQVVNGGITYIDATLP